jgi:phosphatidate cytidylyltransferase
MKEDLKRRALAASIFGPAVFLVFYLFPPIPFLLFLSLFLLFAFLELCRMAAIKDSLLATFLVLSSLFFLLRSRLSFLLFVLLTPCAFLILSLLRGQRTPRTPLDLTGAMTVAVFSELFLALPLFHLFLLKKEGTVFAIFALLSLWAADIAAYLVGRSLGRTPLSPSLSPRKTCEGLLGAILGSTAVAVAMKGMVGLSSSASVLIGICLGLLSQLGDLFESVAKRVFGAKDSSNLIPGHGGLLDRFDSFIFSVPFLYYSLMELR